MEIGKGKKEKEMQSKNTFFWQPTKGRRRSVELEKLQQLVVPGGQPTNEPKRTRTHTSTPGAQDPSPATWRREPAKKYVAEIFWLHFWFVFLFFPLKCL